MNSPILYLSSCIIRNKSAYYRLLQRVRTHERWEINAEIETMSAEMGAVWVVFLMMV